MNTRGLVELVILNAGTDLGILSPALFTMMVLNGSNHYFYDQPDSWRYENWERRVTCHYRGEANHPSSEYTQSQPTASRGVAVQC